MSASHRTDYDAIYHRLFSHPSMVAQLLRAFVAAPWLDDLDLDRMERLNAKFHTTPGQRREGDMAWRIPRRDGSDAYLVLMLEFQSTSDRWMALRVLLYASLLWDHLARENRLPAAGKLPPVLPIVLYNGDTRWGASTDLADLVGLPTGSPLWPWQPGSRYYVIDEGGFDDDDLAGRDGLPALLFRIEAAKDATEAIALADEALNWVAGQPGLAPLYAAITDLLRATILPKGVTVPPLNSPTKEKSMLATNAQVWIRQWKDEGRLEGEARALVRLLTHRFGEVPEWALDRIGAADQTTLETWSLRVLDVDRLDDVFA